MSEILFLAHRVPFPPNRGDKIRSCHLLKKLARLAPVHVGCFAETEEDRAGGAEITSLAISHHVANRTKPLVLAGAEAVLSGKPVSLCAFHNKSLEDWVHTTIATRPISTIFVFSGQMGQYIPEDFGGRVIIDLCDVDSAKFENYAQAGERIWLNSREARLLAQEEERLAQIADVTLLISKNEASLFRSRLKAPENANVQVVGNGIDAAFFDPAIVSPHSEIGTRSGPHLVFTGQMDYAPNIKAVLWAVNSFWPVFRRENPDAELHIVGRNPSKQLTDLAKEGVTVWGEVPDVRPFIAAADCVVAPLTIARGVQNKVLEAMAMERPVILTSEAATGIAAQDDRDWLLCPADAAVMARRIDALLASPTLAESIGRNARRYVLAHHDWDAMLAPLEEFSQLESVRSRNAA